MENQKEKIVIKFETEQNKTEADALAVASTIEAVATMIEEVLKPSGVYILLVRWPELLTSRIYTALLAAVGGLSFAVVENIIYLQFYFPEHTQTLVVFRYTACLTIHVVCSFILGFGINQKLLASVRGEIPLLKGNQKFFIIPMIMHSLFNIMAVLLQSRLGV